MAKAKGIKTFLWFDGNAEEAAKFYVKTFKGRLGGVTRYPEGSPGPAGSVMTVEFRILGQDFVGLNGGPLFKFNESVSFAVPCATQKEIDYYWDALLAGGGKPSMCGWLKDRFGVSWQVFPDIMMDIWSGKDPAKAKRVMQAMLKMVKFDIKALKEAAK